MATSSFKRPRVHYALRAPLFDPRLLILLLLLLCFTALQWGLQAQQLLQVLFKGRHDQLLDFYHGLGEDARPLAHTLNGTYYGKVDRAFDQDMFLGIRYAKQLKAERLFSPPVPLDETWTDSRNATEYQHDCNWYNERSNEFPDKYNQDCLFLNIYRPHIPPDAEVSSIPVIVYIHGGSYLSAGANNRNFYNFAYFIQNSMKLNKPVMSVYINYRLGFEGFAISDEILQEGSTNLGLKDQRLALHWIQENIAAFGGDPTRVTLWGQSAGASSIGFHLLAYGGRDDSLFRSAIMCSGSPIPFYTTQPREFYEPLYQEILDKANCSGASHGLDCLRTVPSKKLHRAVFKSVHDVWMPIVDGDLIQELPSQQLAKGNFVKVPILIGTNSDDGLGFAKQRVNSEKEFIKLLETKRLALPSLTLNESIKEQILEAYPDDPCFGLPAYLGCKRFPGKGREFRRVTAYETDALFAANRRMTTEAWARENTPAYSYRFDVVTTSAKGAAHGSDLAYVLRNPIPLKVLNTIRPKDPEKFFLPDVMANLWLNFVCDSTPNLEQQGYESTPLWPPYNNDRPQNMVLVKNDTYVEDDDFRAEGIALINNLAKEFNR